MSISNDRHDVSRPSLRGLVTSRILVPLAYLRKQPIQRRIDRDRPSAPPHPARAVLREFDFFDEAGKHGRVFRLVPKVGAHKSRRILYFHGGYYVFNLTKYHWTILTGLARRTRAEIVIPHYPLAPEANVEDGMACAQNHWESLVGQVGPENIIIAGDSAGGGLTLAFTQHLVAHGQSVPAGLILFAPWLDATASDPDQMMFAKRDAILTLEYARQAGQMWAGKRDTSDPMVSPLFGAMHGLPPMLAFCGTRDMLLSDVNRLAVKLPSLDLRIYPEMFHVWMAIDIPEGRHALDCAAKFAIQCGGWRA